MTATTVEGPTLTKPYVKPIITAEDALEVLALAVAERGADFRYFERFPQHVFGGTCRNAVQGAPACIVGTALALRGVPVDELPETGSVRGTAEQLERRRWHGLLGGEAISVLQRAQATQDDDKSWGHALAAAGARALEFIEARPFSDS